MVQKGARPSVTGSSCACSSHCNRSISSISSAFSWSMSHWQKAAWHLWTFFPLLKKKSWITVQVLGIITVNQIEPMNIHLAWVHIQSSFHLLRLRAPTTGITSAGCWWLSSWNITLACWEILSRTTNGSDLMNLSGLLTLATFMASLPQPKKAQADQAKYETSNYRSCQNVARGSKPSVGSLNPNHLNLFKVKMARNSSSPDSCTPRHPYLEVEGCIVDFFNLIAINETHQILT